MTVAAAAGIGESPVLVFIESELLGYLDEAAKLSTALHEASRRSVERGEE